MRLRTFSIWVLVLVLPVLAVSAHADILGAAAPYAVIGGSGVTNAGAGVLGATSVTGSVAALAANSCTGFFLCDGGPGLIFGGTAQVANATALGVEGVGGADTAELALLASGPATDLTGLTLGVGLQASLPPGVYSFSTTAALSNTLTLAGGGNAAPVWIFQIGSGLTTDSLSHVVVTGTGAASAGVYWVIGTGGQTGGATLGQDSTFQGNIFADSFVTLQPGAQITCGRAFADTLVHFDGMSSAPNENVVNSDLCASGSPNGNNNGVITPGGGVGPGTPVPEPGTLALLSSGLAIGLLMYRKLSAAKCAVVNSTTTA